MMQLLPAEPIYRDFGRRLRKARRECGLTQEALAKRVALTRTSITNIEQGNQHVGLHLLFDLAKAVGVPAVTLLPDEGAVQNDGLALEQVLDGMRRADRAKVERDMLQLPTEDRERILRLVEKEVARDAGHDKE